jgi:phosphoserine phosphatase
MIDRIDLQNRKTVPDITIEDRILTMLITAATTKAGEPLTEFSRFALFVLLVRFHEANSLRQMRASMVTAVACMDKVETRLVLGHCFAATEDEEATEFLQKHRMVKQRLDSKGDIYAPVDRWRNLLLQPVQTARVDTEHHEISQPRDLPELSQGALRRLRYAVNPRQPGRPHTTVEKVEITLAPGSSKISGRIERMLPIRQREMKWTIAGTKTDRHLFMVFSPINERDPHSRGTINLSRTGDPRESLTYTGKLLRPVMSRDMPDEIVELRYGLHEDLSLVALCDYDSTLRPNETIVAWLEFLQDELGWPTAGRTLGQIRRLIREYQDGKRSHDQLSARYARAYAKFMAGRSVAETEAAVRRFVNNGAGGGLWPFVPPLLTGLRKLNIEPVVITGAPRELVTAHLEPLGIRRMFALELEQMRGKFTGNVRVHHGERTAKQNVVNELIDGYNGSGVLILGAGDSESDLPLIDDAHVQLIVGSGRGMDMPPFGQRIVLSPEQARDERSARKVLRAIEDTGICLA